MISLLLSDEGYTVIEWPSGAGAYAMTLRERPDLILLDLRLEKSRTGLTVLEEIRSNPQTCATAIIVCSGDVHFLREHGAMLRAWRCGVIEKPFDIAELLALIRAFTGAQFPADCVA